MPSLEERREELRRIQELVWDLITAPQGVGPGAERLKKEGRLPTTDLSFLIRGTEKLPAADRLDIYASMYFYRLRDGLAEDFPKVVSVIGGARFHNLITDYLLVHPSRSWSLRYVGEPLAGYLDRHPLIGEYPFLSDLARLEWARIEAFDDADAAPVARDRLTRLKPAEIESRRFGLVPACRLLSLEWSVAPLWKSIEESQGETESAGHNSEAAVASEEFVNRPPIPFERPEEARSYIRVWRQGFSVFHRTMWADEHACLVRLRDAGATLAELGELVLEHMVAEDPGAGRDLQSEAAQRLAAMVDLWLAEGLIREER